MKKFDDWLNESSSINIEKIDSMIEIFKDEYRRFNFSDIEQDLINATSDFDSEASIKTIEAGLNAVSKNLDNEIFSIIVTENTAEILKKKYSVFGYMFNELIHNHNKWKTKIIYKSTLDSKKIYITKVFCKPMNVDVPICVWNGVKWNAAHYYISKNSIFEYIKALCDDKMIMKLPTDVIEDFKRFNIMSQETVQKVRGRISSSKFNL